MLFKFNVYPRFAISRQLSKDLGQFPIQSAQILTASG